MKSDNPAKSDDQLIKSLVRGEPGTFDQLFSRHSESALGYATRLLGGNVAKAEDVVQSAWEKVILNIPEYQHQGKFRAWLFTLVRNTTLDLLRSDQRQKWDSRPIEDLEETMMESESPSQNEIEEVLDRHLNVSRMKAAIDQLPDRQRFVLTAWMTERLTAEELSKEMGISVKAVGALLIRAKKGLESGIIGIEKIKGVDKQ